MTHRSSCSTCLCPKPAKVFKVKHTHFTEDDALWVTEEQSVDKSKLFLYTESGD